MSDSSKIPRLLLLSIFIIFIVAVLTGCFSFKSPVKEIYEVLEKVAGAEQPFAEQQDEMAELENKEKEIYNQMISLGEAKFDEMEKLSDEALKIVEKRKKYMEIEGQSIQDSRDQFKNVKPLIEKLDEPDEKKYANKLYDTMMERYKAYDELYASYMKGLEYDREIYEMFKEKDISLEELEKQIKKINNTYKMVMKSNEKFNEETKEYNDIKLQFYKSAGIQVKQNTKD